MTEWHARYGGRGVMIWWHVDTNSTCIYSQLRRCSSSEAAAMMEGVLRHCTDMAIERQYVDSHGQSEVAFAFSYILGFDLLPRFKAIAKQKLSLVASTDAAEYPNLEPILTRAINREFDSATVRRNHQVYDRTETGHGRTGSHPPPLYPWRCGASDLQRR